MNLYKITMLHDRVNHFPDHTLFVIAKSVGSATKMANKDADCDSFSNKMYWVGTVEIVASTVEYDSDAKHKLLGVDE